MEQQWQKSSTGSEIQFEVQHWPLGEDGEDGGKSSGMDGYRRGQEEDGAVCWLGRNCSSFCRLEVN